MMRIRLAPMKGRPQPIGPNGLILIVIIKGTSHNENVPIPQYRGTSYVKTHAVEVNTFRTPG
jgi:hypothetical protein